jgi:hypothetical protein
VQFPESCVVFLKNAWIIRTIEAGPSQQNTVKFVQKDGHLGRTFFPKVCHGSYNRTDIIPGSMPGPILGWVMLIAKPSKFHYYCPTTAKNL